MAQNMAHIEQCSFISQGHSLVELAAASFEEPFIAQYVGDFLPRVSLGRCHGRLGRLRAAGAILYLQARLSVSADPAFTAG
jgi:hypothetical protein